MQVDAKAGLGAEQLKQDAGSGSVQASPQGKPSGAVDRADEVGEQEVGTCHV